MIDTKNNKIPVVWSISGSDSCGGTGIQSDLKTYHDFGACGCSVITAITAQNSFAAGYSVATERKSVVAQINALDSDMPADVIKVGILPNLDIVETVVKYFDDYQGYVVYDLELEASGEHLLAEAGDLLRSSLLPRVDLLVVNVEEAAALTDAAITTFEEMEAAAASLMASGTRSVLVTGAKFGDNGQRYDYWAEGTETIWVTVEGAPGVNNRGGGCVLSAAIAAALSQGHSFKEALSLAKAYVTQGIRGAKSIGSGPGAVAHLGLPTQDGDKPHLSGQRPA
ncbi:MAG: hydroxymethylpyrimidine/phosphomethylpyrimidine kinase [Oceanicoccus sp.]|uniref:bifunctional hydroxymethylpyrimidine kinase/phosphomethylpyrimidine kinase n=1 Tax=Oceanicoccus sp. TaxID=2691044 RepID=UPI00260BBF17|nr:hydroxymethylpyrimidine/phosphomethylpyrimidine kinase [Oceanicoccus sp.]MCP3907832.1 hydroxymethylpyrimidine/phosphomethylpyrimidine kinase [Oceanicoccus sp.]MDG1772329.1 hydroxymethylpyrimidine/phosphomethylpyrimidine kinase [Oceanicoccus sp.]